MDHIVYLDARAKELENLLSGQKTIIIRGATGRRLPHVRVDKGDTLYLIKNNAEGIGILRVAAIGNQRADPVPDYSTLDIGAHCTQITNDTIARCKWWFGYERRVSIARSDIQSRNQRSKDSNADPTGPGRL